MPNKGINLTALRGAGHPENVLDVPIERLYPVL